MEDLQNDHNVFILGAGFSAPAGLPVINNFLNKMRDAREYYAGKGNSEEVKNIDEVMAFRLKASSSAYRINIDLEDIEQLFSLASASNENITDSIKRAICSTIAYCQNREKPQVSFIFRKDKINNNLIGDYFDRGLGSDKVEYKIPLYNYIAGILSGKYSNSNRNTVISFNYDTLLEDAFDQIGERFSYGLKRKLEFGDYESIPILKLHGSINWGIIDGKDDSHKIFPSYEKLLEFGSHQPLLIPPTWNKNFGAHLRRIWEKSILYLSKATRIIFIGFSMPDTDMHFKYLLASGLQKNISLREIIFIDRDLETIKEKELKLFNNHPVKRIPIKYLKNYHSTQNFFSDGGTVRINRKDVFKCTQRRYSMD